MRSTSKRWAERAAYKSAEKYMNEHYNELKYQTFSENVNDIVKQAVAMMCFALRNDFGFGTKRLQKAVDSFVAVLNMPDIFGEKPKVSDCMAMFKEKHGIDFDKIHVRMESLEEYKRK